MEIISCVDSIYPYSGTILELYVRQSGQLCIGILFVKSGRHRNPPRSGNRFAGVETSLAEVGHYAQDGAEIMVENGWMEQPPKAPNRKDLTRV